MSIVRTHHDKENPYVMLNKASLWDSGLSLEAVGLWGRLMSRPDNWEVRASELAKSCKINIKKIWKLLGELINAGYAYRFQSRKPRGFGKFEYYVFESKKTKKEIKKMSVHSQNVQCTDVLCTKRDTTNKEERLKKEETKTPPPSSFPPPTKEEEELIEKRFRERPKGLPEIRNKPKWKAVVLQEMRKTKNESEETAREREELTAKHKEVAKKYDGQKIKGYTVCAREYHVEFVSKIGAATIGYAVSDEEWTIQTGWK